MRLISMQTGIPFGAMRRRKMTKDEWGLFNQAVEDMENLPYHVNDLSAIDVNSMRQVYRQTEAVHGKIDLVIVDYLQLQSPDGDYGTREQEVSSISRGLKAMAKEFVVPVFAAAQLSRAMEKRSEKRPVLSDLRESGSLEQDSDNVLFIYRPDQYENKNAKQNIAEIICAKHRNGATGNIELIWRAAVTKFENAETKMFRPNDYTEV
jgi:replicative DNA helicase